PESDIAMYANYLKWDINTCRARSPWHIHVTPSEMHQLSNRKTFCFLNVADALKHNIEAQRQFDEYQEQPTLDNGEQPTIDHYTEHRHSHSICKSAICSYIHVQVRYR